MILPAATFSWTWTGPHRVEATDPVTDVVPDELEPEDPDVVPDEVWPDVPALPEVPLLRLLIGGFDSIDVVAVVAGPEVEVLYPNSSTTMDTVLSTHRAMRLMRSPRKGLEMEAVRRQAGCDQGVLDELGPGSGAAHVHVAFGRVGDPVQERVEVTDTTYAVA